MKVYVTSVGEKTTDFCVKQWKKYGFEVILMDEKEPWIEKYKRFIQLAHATGEDVIRCDADIIPNKNVGELQYLAEIYKTQYVVQFMTLNFLSLDLYPSCPMIYKRTGLQVMNALVDKIDSFRPETQMCRMPETVNYVFTSPMVMGINGFFQKEEDFERQIANRIKRGQTEQYDFNLAKEVYNTFCK